MNKSKNADKDAGAAPATNVVMARRRFVGLVAPLFDNGYGFYSWAAVAELEVGRYLWGSHPFRPCPSQQLALVGDLSWYDPSLLDGFEDDIASTLSLKPCLDGRFVEAVQRQTACQMAVVNDAAAERGRVFAGF